MNGQHANAIRASERIAESVSFVEVVVGLAALALAIIGLANVFPWVPASIATIALGAALLFEAGSVGARCSALAEDTAETRKWERWSGMTTSVNGPRHKSECECHGK